MRVRVLTNIPTPYNDALFGALARRPGIDLRVAYCAERESNRSWVLPADKPYAYDVLRGWTLRSSVHVNPGIARWIERERPDVVIVSGGYTVPTLQAAAWILHARRIPWLFWGEELGGESKGAIGQSLRDALRLIVTRATAVLAIGERACHSYAAIGIPRHRIHDFHYYPDVGHFALPTDAKADARAAIRRTWGIAADATVFAFVGQLVHRKGVDTLLRARAAMQSATDECVVVIMGDGPQDGEYRRLAEELGISRHIRFAGFAQPEALPRHLAAAEVLVVPSRKEGWGLVVGEAMAAGLPVIASTEVNAAYDLIRAGGGGLIVPPDDPGELAAAMHRLFADPGLRATLASRALDTADAESPERAASRLEELLRACARPAAIAAGAKQRMVHA